MRDILPPESDRWRRFVGVFADTVSAAGYGQVIAPLLEDIGVFQRMGEATDVVSKEMYDFIDKGERHIALRPEQTASVCRAFVQHRPATPWKVWYAGPNFRYEKPQRGRYRQFEQVGIEVLGAEDPYLDVEVIALGWDFLQTIGLRNVALHLNSLGESDERQQFVVALEKFFRGCIDELSEESKITLDRNPLRVLDSKRDQDRPVIAAAPKIIDFLGEASFSHFNAVQEGLTTLGIPFVVNETLVRGLDYYRQTTFEFVGGTLGSAQNALGGGGRYDSLVEDLGGPPTPGIGFAIGLDRSLIACDDEGVFAPTAITTDVFVVDVTGGFEALKVTAELRRLGLVVERAFDNRSMKSQMKAADKSGAQLAVIIGPDELAQGIAVLRLLRSSESEQVTVNRSDLGSAIQKALS
ncbi:MAG: histidyl-tRNA synthetase [Actinomycetota bacterium]